MRVIPNEYIATSVIALKINMSSSYLLCHLYLTNGCRRPWNSYRSENLLSLHLCMRFVYMCQARNVIDIDELSCTMIENARIGEIYSASVLFRNCASH